MVSDSELNNHIAILDGTCVTLRGEATDIMQIIDDLREEHNTVQEHLRTLVKDRTIPEGIRENMLRDLMVEKMVLARRMDRRQARVDEIVDMVARLQDEKLDLMSGRSQLA